MSFDDLKQYQKGFQDYVNPKSTFEAFKEWKSYNQDYITQNNPFDKIDKLEQNLPQKVDEDSKQINLSPQDKEEFLERTKRKL